jgi:putative (di)nucleoside polyphosphate hydrolase
VGVALKGKYRGQTQKWFALRFTGADSEVDLGAHGHPEFASWRWAAIDEVEGLIVPFKREVYAKVVRQFRHWARPSSS